MSWLSDICQRCNTTHALNDAGERPCPAPPSEERPGSGPFLIPVPGMYSFDKRLPPIKINGKEHRP